MVSIQTRMPAYIDFIIGLIATYHILAIFSFTIILPRMRRYIAANFLGSSLLSLLSVTVICTASLIMATFRICSSWMRIQKRNCNSHNQKNFMHYFFPSLLVNLFYHLYPSSRFVLFVQCPALWCIYIIRSKNGLHL